MGGAEYMISAYGLINDPTMRHFLDAARTRGVATRFVDLALAVECGWEIRLPPDERSWTNTPEGRIPLLNGLPAYCRLIDLGSIETQSAASWHAFTSALSGWLELDTGRVVNRPGHPQDNASKPLHEAILARMGLEVPPSFSGSGRSELIGFAEQGPTIAKALCGQRTDCRRVTVEDFADYEDAQGPVHLQRFVEGEDVRAHVIGESVLAVSVRSANVDYRLDRSARFQEISLPNSLCRQLVAATAAHGFTFVGWDLRISSHACWTLEMNPMPGYSYYDDKLNGAISDVLIDYLLES